MCLFLILVCYTLGYNKALKPISLCFCHAFHARTSGLGLTSSMRSDGRKGIKSVKSELKAHFLPTLKRNNKG